MWMTFRGALTKMFQRKPKNSTSGNVRKGEEQQRLKVTLKLKSRLLSLQWILRLSKLL